MFVFTRLEHFTKMKHELARMVRSVFPHPMGTIYFTGLWDGFRPADCLGSTSAPKG
jgi:hypothetical protein